VPDLTQEVIGAVCALLGTKVTLPAALTQSGTESIVLAMSAAARLTGRREVVAAASVHPSVRHAADLLGMTLRTAPISAAGRVDLDAIEDLTGDRTALVVVSAPTWAAGVLDPLETAASLARTRGAYCHIDACIGGFLIPFMRDQVGQPPPSLIPPHATSLSVDLHKFGYGPRNLSVLCCLSPEVWRVSGFRATDWDGFTYETYALGAEHPLSPLIGAWAVQRALGHEGYLRFAQVLAGRKAQAQAALSPFGETHAEPFGHVVQLRPADHDLIALSDRLERLGSAHRVCRDAGFIRMRIDPLADERDFSAGLTELAELLQ
jgi:glutamate/tyrosine decarboxylase-like PLP-dependent enzyme